MLSRVVENISINISRYSLHLFDEQAIFTSAILSRPLFSFATKILDRLSLSLPSPSSPLSLSPALCIKNLCEPQNFLTNNDAAGLRIYPDVVTWHALRNARDRSVRGVEQVGRGAKIPGIKSPLIPTKTITLLLLGRHPKLWPSHFAVQTVGSYLIFIAAIARKLEGTKGSRATRAFVRPPEFWGKEN